VDNEIWFLLIGAAAAFSFGLIRDLVIDNRRNAASRDAEEKRWRREDDIRQEAVQLALDEERRRIAREDALRDREERGARRLVADELDTIANHLTMLLEADAWPEVPLAGFLPTDRWDEHKATLASAMESQADFGALAGFAYSVGQLRARIDRSYEYGGICFPADVRVRLEGMKQTAEALRWVVHGRHKLVTDDAGVRAMPIEDTAGSSSPEP
jgi:hypothetical protein